MKEKQVVVAVGKHRFAAVPAGHQMIDRPGILTLFLTLFWMLVAPTMENPQEGRRYFLGAGALEAAGFFA